MAAETDSRASFASLLSGLVSDLGQLFRQEVALARQEIHDDVEHAKGAAIRFAIAAGAGALGGVFLLVAVALGVADAFGWPPWTGFAGVGAILALAGVALGVAGRAQARAIHAVPPQTVETLKENVAWVKQRTGSGAR